jgi:hypothetical protein
MRHPGGKWFRVEAGNWGGTFQCDKLSFPHNIFQKGSPMKLDLDSQSIDIPCQACGKKIPEKIGRLKNNPKLTCPKCKAVTSVDAAQLRRAIESAQKSIDDLGRKLKNMFK